MPSETLYVTGLAENIVPLYQKVSTVQYGGDIVSFRF